jgi:hypothetical protein
MYLVYIIAGDGISKLQVSSVLQGECHNICNGFSPYFPNHNSWVSQCTAARVPEIHLKSLHTVFLITVWQMATEVLEEHTVSIFRVRPSNISQKPGHNRNLHYHGNLKALCIKGSSYSVPLSFLLRTACFLKCWHLTARLHDATAQKSTIRNIHFSEYLKSYKLTSTSHLWKFTCHLSRSMLHTNDVNTCHWSPLIHLEWVRDCIFGALILGDTTKSLKVTHHLKITRLQKENTYILISSYGKLL